MLSSLAFICTLPDSIFLIVLPEIVLFSLVDIFDYFALQRVAQWLSSFVKISLHIICTIPNSIFVIVVPEIVLFSLVDIFDYFALQRVAQWLSSFVKISLHIICTIPNSIFVIVLPEIVLPEIVLFSLVDIFDYFALQRVAQWFSSFVKISLHIICTVPNSIFSCPGQLNR